MVLLNLFISEADLAGMRAWRYSVVDNSVTTKIFTPFWNWLVSKVPRECAPNVLTLAGFFCIIQGFLISATYRHSHPRLTALGATSLGFLYWHLDAIDGKHARNTRNSSPLGELFDHACDNMSCAMATVQLMWIIGVEDTRLLWAVTQAFTLNFLTEHVEPFNARDKTIRFSFLAGPGEAIIIWLSWQLFHVFGILKPAYALVVSGVEVLDKVGRASTLGVGIPWPEGVTHADYVTELSVLLATLFFGSKAVIQAWNLRPENATTRKMLLLCFFIRAAPAYFVLQSLDTFGDTVGECLTGLPPCDGWHGGGSLCVARGSTLGKEVTVARVLSDGMFMSILTSDMIIAKMAGRQLHPLVPLMCLASTLGWWVGVVCTFIYYFSILWDICSGLNLPLLTPVVNIYCDGVFDLCHLGHMRQFEQALTSTRGTRLIVGVISDKVATGYKRPPIMNEAERYATVRACRHVHEVVEDCPLITDKEFITRHNIHLFAVGEEYVDDPDDKYYEVPRAMGILHSTKRTTGISSTDLFDRVASRGPGAAARAEPAKEVNGRT